MRDEVPVHSKFSASKKKLGLKRKKKKKVGHKTLMVAKIPKIRILPASSGKNHCQPLI